MESSAAERKRKRLEAWRRRQQSAAPAPQVKVSISLGGAVKNTVKKKKTRNVVNRAPPTVNPFGDADDDDDDRDAIVSRKRKALLTFEPDDGEKTTDESGEKPSKRRNRGSRWDAGPAADANESVKQSSAPSTTSEPRVDDALDKFMERLEAGALGSVATQLSEKNSAELLTIDVGGSVMRIPKLKQQAPQPSPVSGSSITPEHIAKLATSKSTKSSSSTSDPDALYTHSDWESDAMGDTGEVSGTE